MSACLSVIPSGSQGTTLSSKCHRFTIYNSKSGTIRFPSSNIESLVRLNLSCIPEILYELGLPL